MHSHRALSLALLVVSLTACHSPNVSSADNYHPPKAPKVEHPDYDPYAAYGEAHAIWEPPVVNRAGTIVKPDEPSTSADRPDYEHAPWATGADTGRALAPPGTF